MSLLNLVCRQLKLNKNNVYVTEFFLLADPGGGAWIHDFLNVQTAKFPHTLHAIHYKHNNSIRQRAKNAENDFYFNRHHILCFSLPPPQLKKIRPLPPKSNLGSALLILT